MMHLDNIFLALLQLSLSLGLAVAVSYTTFRWFEYFLRKRYQIAPNNIAFAILTGAGLLAVGHILSGILPPTLNLVRTLSRSQLGMWQFMVQSLQYLVLFIGLGAFFAGLTIGLGLYLFTRLTRHLHEIEEIIRDNIAVGILTGCIIILIAWFVRDSTVFLLESLIPYPTLPFRD